jgi:hypothetical protein
MKFTHEERTRIKAWLEKNAKSEDQGKYLNFTKDDGTDVTLARTTTYFGDNNQWKVRIAYDLRSGFPLLMSSPIPGGQDSKGTGGGHKLVPKLPLKKAAPAKKKPAGKGKLLPAWDWDVDVLPISVTKYMEYQIQKSIPKDLPTGASKKAIKGSKALYGTYDTLFVKVGQTFTGQFYTKIKHLTVPVGYSWVQAANHDLYTLVKT